MTRSTHVDGLFCDAVAAIDAGEVRALERLLAYLRARGSTVR
jgi:hypothetical protein